MGKDSGIGVLDKSVMILHVVAEQPCNLGELCELTGLPRATAHRLAVGLEVHQMVARDESGRWIPGPTLGRLAASARDIVRDAALMVLPRLQETTGESVQLYRREGAERVCIAAAEPPTGLRDTVPEGTRLPMSAGSAAKVLAAWSDPDTVRTLLADAAYTDRSLAEIRRRGWAQSVAERSAGVASISAPVRDGSGAVVAAVSVSGPVDRMGRRPGERWATDVLGAAEAISARLTSSAQM
ncbi:IclR family transcriptional regulator [Gordonia sp. (in: high G+C Gram-positive bacteria)]|uniref:IclR family transcriptional regulator n=1 Tax=Gordonia sp. (in: high G+C Gram-positive bacteria) TaxID=84139 RepID=UPI0016A55DA9|nr:IclR family transcriptional regulator [Gordonia sp. (in: high G+C Gram-positive bacteria)]NLG46697.1 IclR family transcriptional regulator [Gordonia sp. (in: high G+C Gram-positive bacteria)]